MIKNDNVYNLNNIKKLANCPIYWICWSMTYWTIFNITVHTELKYIYYVFDSSC